MIEESSRIIPVPIEEEVKRAYLNYAMSVIVSRALPDVRDGLKPVHRRLLYAMSELGLHPGSATKKCARITGDAMGKYHPHGDLSLYDALVRLAQDFSLRYPLVQGQGNFGSIDGDAAAASRYTEARLSKLGEEMLSDLEKDTIDFVPNYDESLKEPSVLPASFPNLIVNGSSGIAVGMATNMLPHNLKEVVSAICAYIDDPNISVDGLMRHIRGPDFPTGGIIHGRKSIAETYEFGRGKIIVRGKYHIEDLKNGKEQIVFTEIPYAINKSKIIERIAALVQSNIIPSVADLRDESSREGIRVVLELKKGAIVKLILNRLFAHTQLQNSYGVINMAIVDGRPRQLSLRELIGYFIDHRVSVVTRRSQYDLKKAIEKAHILHGLIIALAHIDEVIRVIKASKDSAEALAGLVSHFELDTVQGQAILDMRLARLTSLEVSKIENELRELESRIAYLRDLLSSAEKIRQVVKDEMSILADKYKDERKTLIVEDDLEQLEMEDLIKREEMMIIISKKGFIKRMSVNSYRNQAPGGKGSNSTSLVDDDYIIQIFVASTHDHILFISTAGRAFWLKAYAIPETSKVAHGSYIKSLLTLENSEGIAAIVDIPNFNDERYVMMGTRKGIIKKTAIKSFANAKTHGVIAINLDEDDLLVSACLTEGNNDIVLITRKGYALKVMEKQIRPTGRTSRGMKGIKLRDTDSLASMLRVIAHGTIFLLSSHGYGKRVEYSCFLVHSRNTKGQIIYSPDEVTGDVAGAITVEASDELVVITSMGKTLKLSASNVSIHGKTAKGARILKIDEPDSVIGVDRVIEEVSPASLDVGIENAGISDTGNSNTDSSDTGISNASIPDAGISDAGNPDDNNSDAGNSENT